MKEINPGITHTIHKTVEKKDTATAYGSGDVEVFATPSMIALMEETALKSVQPYLEEQQTTVGFEVNIRHFKATRCGEEVVCKSILSDVKKRKLTFKVEVFHNEETIGDGSHIRYIVSKDDF